MNGYSNKLIVHVDLDNVICDYSGALRDAKVNQPDVAYPEMLTGFFRNMKMLDGALDSMKKLYNSLYYNPFILTTCTRLTPAGYVEKKSWIEEHLGAEFVDRLIVLPHKHLLRGDILIGDNEEGRRLETFEGYLIPFGNQMFASWSDVADELFYKLMP